VHHDSFEARVIARLAQRSRAAQLPLTAPLALGEVSASRERWLRALAARGLRRDTPPFSGVTSSFPVPQRPGAVYASRGNGGRLHLMFTTNLVDRSGRHARRHVSVIRAQTSLRTLSRAHARLFAARTQVADALRADLANAVAATQARCCETSAPLERRCRAIAAELAARRQQTAYQGSLFDRRAEQRAHTHQSALLDLQAHVERRIADAVALGTVAAATPQLVAVWLGE
jgi:hypothetical protein